MAIVFNKIDINDRNFLYFWGIYLQDFLVELYFSRLISLIIVNEVRFIFIRIFLV
jgi:hypothetical protein